MRRETKNEKKPFLRDGKRVLAGALILSMALSGSVWASLNNGLNNDIKMNTQAEGDILLGDVDMNGKVDLADANLTLKAALGITTLEAQKTIRADLDGNKKVDLADANTVLKMALGIKPAVILTPAPLQSAEPTQTAAPTTGAAITTAPTPEPVTPTPIPEPTDTPHPTPAYIYIPEELSPVAADLAEPATGSYVEYEEMNGAKDYFNDHQIEFGEQTEGVEVVNPFVGVAKLKQTVVQATSLDAEPGKVNCWTLSGASLSGTNEAEFDDMDKRIWNAEDQETVTYTRPNWTNGITVSFWLKTDADTSHGEPMLTFAGGSQMLVIRQNGSVQFKDGAEQLNMLDLTSTSYLHGTYGEWNYYTITIANDWIQVYVNGQENLYTQFELNRKKIQQFNDGFLTRYNSLGTITEEDVKNDVRKYYVKSGEWYFETEQYWTYMYHDNFSVLGNNRFRGANNGSKLIMDMITDPDTKMYIGGATTAFDLSEHRYVAGTKVSDFKVYMEELTAEQIAATYAQANTNATPNPNPVYVEPTKKPTPTPDLSVTPMPTVDPFGGQLVSVAAENVAGGCAAMSRTDNILKFGEATGASLDKVKGVEVTNPFAGNEALRQTIEEALSGQSIFPWYVDEQELDMDDNPVFNADGTPKIQRRTYASQTNKYTGGHDRYSAEVFRGNFYDVYYGPVDEYGNAFFTNPTTKQSNREIATKADLMSEADLEKYYGDQKTTYQRPVWTEGASVSFWVKPVEIDDSPVISFYRTGYIAMYVDVRGDLAFYSLDTEDWTKKVVKFNGEPKNTLACIGDDSYVKANEWNYYTVTIANDWIQVYINGKEMVYEKANLNRGDIKKIGCRYLTRYNTIGIWTADMLAKYGDPSGKTLEGTERNYLTKSGYYYNLDAPSQVDANGTDRGPLSDKGANSGKDGASIRMNNAYEAPFGGATTENEGGGKLLMNLFTAKKVQMFIGGVYSPINNDGTEYTFSSMNAPKDADPALVKYDYKDHDNNKDGEIKDTDEDGDGEIENIEVGTASKKQFFSTQHTLDAGTKIASMKTYNKELTAQDAALVFEYANAEAGSPGAVEVK